jgi:hypothetical protein
MMRKGLDQAQKILGIFGRNTPDGARPHIAVFGVKPVL